MEEPSPGMHWLGANAQLLPAMVRSAPESSHLLNRLRLGPPKTPDDWHLLIRSSARYGSIPLLEAVLDHAPSDSYGRFELQFDKVADIDDDCLALIVQRVWLPSIHSLQSLRIAHVRLSAFAIEHIADLVRTSTTLQQLRIESCELGSDGACQLWVAALETKSPLWLLDLSYSVISGALERVAALARYPGALRHLALACAELTTNDAVALAAALPGWKTLEILDLFGNDIGDEGGAALLEAAVGHPSLKTLSLYRCQLASRSAEALVKLAANTGALQVLKLGRNDFSRLKPGLGAAMQANHGLRHLDLSMTQLVAASVNDLLCGLVGPQCSLQVLELSDNVLSELDVSPLVGNTSLRRLTLVGSQLAPARYEALAAVLAAHPALEVLRLDMESGDEVAMKHLADGLARNRSLRSLSLSGWGSLSDSQIKKLLRAIEGNSVLSVLCVPYLICQSREVQTLFEQALKNSIALTDVSGRDFEWFPRSGAPAPLERALVRNERANDASLMTALQAVIKKCLLLGCARLPEELGEEIAALLLGDSRPRSVEALRAALRLREVNKELAGVPMPPADRKR